MSSTKNKNIYFLFLVMIVISSCNNNQRKDVVKIIAEWQNKEIIFPHDIVFTQYGLDTTDYEVPQSEYKILLYVDAVGCTSCKLQLNKWAKFIDEIDSLTLGQVPILFFFHPKDRRELIHLLKRDNISLPVCFDTNDQLNTINHFPTRDDLQCFLLDRNNNVMCIGNPIYNPKIKEMYLEQISSVSYTQVDQLPNTTVSVEQASFKLGAIKQGTSVTVTATVNNTGDVPLVIHNVETSCDCTTVSYQKEEVEPKSTFKIDITYNADDLGFFDRVIYIYGNIERSPLIIELEGEVR